MYMNVHVAQNVSGVLTVHTRITCIVVFFLQLTGPGEAGQIAGYTPRGGCTLLGLGSLLTGAKVRDTFAIQP